MPKDLYLDCFAGVSGDMWVAALLDLGWGEESLHRGLASLGLEDEYHLHVSRQTRHHIGGVKFDVHLEHSHQHPHAHPHEHSHGHEHGPEHHHGDHGLGHHGHDHHHHGEVAEHTHGRNFSQIRELIEGSGLPEPVKQRAVAVFHRVAVAEGKIHGMPPEEVAFHEVGAVDSIVDIVAGCLGIHELGIERVRASRLVEGTGQISCAHGLLPLPAPATLEILAGIPLQQIEVPYEMITPTGAALLAEFSGGFGPMPTMQVERIGYGLGTRDTSPRPNVLRAVLGQFVEVNPLTTPETDRVLELQTNLDDCSPELLAAAVEHLRNAGALEVFLTPVQTKKHRPAWVLTVLSSPSQARTLAEKILEQTTSFGVRWREMDRLILQREVVDFSSSLGPVKIKLGRLGDRLLQVAPEFDAVEQLARQSSQPLRAIWARVEAEARLHFSN